MRKLKFEVEKYVFQGHTAKCWQNQCNEQDLLIPGPVVFDCILFSWDGKVEMGKAKQDGLFASSFSYLEAQIKFEYCVVIIQ